MNIHKKNLWLLVVIVSIFSFVNLFAQTTGKIVGNISDETTNEPLVGANISIEGTTKGAATDLNGDYYIINIPPGSYTLRVQMMGYATKHITNIVVSVNRTTNVIAKLKETTIEGEVVVVTANRISVKKDQTSSVRNVSSEQIEALPIENMADVVEMQAGVVQGHFRGGRLSEVSYLIDGMQVNDTYENEGRAVDIEPEVVQDLEIITGTFNAEYGRAMSGIVNAVTKEGGNHFTGSASANVGNYFTNNKAIFVGLKDNEFNRNQDYKFQISGPFLKDRISFITNLRYQDNKNYLNGLRRFNVSDLSDFSDDTFWYSEHTGDNKFVPMNSSNNISLFSKITSRFSDNAKLSFSYKYNDDHWRQYSHIWKYNPDGMMDYYRKTAMYSLYLNHLVFRNVFYEINLSYMDNYKGEYVFEDRYDDGYVHDEYSRSAGSGFYTGGQQKNNNQRTLKDLNAKFDLTWQMNKHHNLKTGFLYTLHDLNVNSVDIRNKYIGSALELVAYYDTLAHKVVYPYYEPVVYPDSSIYSEIYRVKPVEFSAYIQDKMEFDEMVINLGVRFDYLDPQTNYPSQLRNPANQLSFPDNPEKMSAYPKADPKYQISPRFGFSYQLGETALLHFSYGHFFQMPPLFALYQNHSFLIEPTNYATTNGNAQIKAQKTVQYEIGLWQELMTGMSIDVALFYRDIYDLLSAKIISTFNQIRYGQFSNKDYGNAKGLEIKYTLQYGKISSMMNYTLQYTRGNADNPTHTFTRAGDSMDPISALIPMSWDQRHTFNLSVSYNAKYYGATLTGYYNSGTPFTWVPLEENRLSLINLYPNNSWKPENYSVDLSAFYDVPLSSNIKLRFNLLAYNLLDHLNEMKVDSKTGRAYTSIIRESTMLSHRSDFNEYIDRIQNPSMYSAPRLVKLGMGIVF
ncbi:TonB-dependent receptor [candidate division KSB1 bacterium]|nr:TonB-dependent receptor [candidate division KSB1 bacterium]